MIPRSIRHDGTLFTLERRITDERCLDLYVIRDEFGDLYAWTEREPAEHHWASLFLPTEPRPAVPSFQSFADRNAAILAMVADRLSYGVIALRLGVTHSVVCGVAYRSRTIAQREAA